MRPARKIREGDQWFVDPAHVFVSECPPDSSSPQGIEEGAVSVVACLPPGLEDDSADPALFELPDQSFQAVTSAAFRTSCGAVEADDDDLDGIPQEVEPRDPLRLQRLVPVQLPHPARRG